MNSLKTVGTFCSLVLVTLAVGSATAHDRHKKEVVFASLSGFEEVPQSVSSPARGTFRAVLDEDEGTIEFRLAYEGFTPENTVTQAHIHFGQRHTAGGISVFFCSNLPNPPTVTQACPLTAGVVTGTLRAADVLGPAGQGIAPGEFAELLRAIRSGDAYANVHSTTFGAGEIRGQIERR